MRGCAAELAYRWSDAHRAKGAKRLWQNHFAENAVGAGAGRVRRCPAFGERRLPRSTSDAAGFIPVGNGAPELEDTPLDEGLLRTRLAQLQLGADKVTLPLSALSGGERLKAALACVLWRREPAQLLLLDEPTNHLDLASTQAIESALAAFPGAMLVVSHDEAFLQGLKLTHSLAWRETGWHFSLL